MSLIKDLIFALLSNFTFVAVVISWFLAQTFKVFYYYFKEGELNLWHFFEAGGMPSAHSASVAALTLGIALTMGFDSPFFTICLVFALIVMYDATGVRRAAGKQALILNRIVEDIYATGKVNQEKLKELIGHTPIEVVVGAVLGLAMTLLTYYVYFIK